MRVNFYKTKLNLQNGRVDVVKERAMNYSPYKRLDSPIAVNDFCTNVLKMHEDAEERAYILCYDRSKRLIGLLELAHGSNNAVHIDIRAMFTKMLLINTEAFVFVHNHPNGWIWPSTDDTHLMEQFWQMGRFLHIEMLDSVIVQGGLGIEYYSFLEHGDFNNYKELI